MLTLCYFISCLFEVDAVQGYLCKCQAIFLLVYFVHRKLGKLVSLSHAEQSLGKGER